MPRRKRDPEQAKRSIIEGATAELCEKGAATATVEAVAKRAECAKGLVLYHFKTKQGLFESAGAAIAVTRATHWAMAFEGGSPPDTIDKTWSLLTTESTNGTTLAWSSLLSPIGQISDHAVKQLAGDFARVLGEAGMGLFASLGTEPRVNEDELGWLLASIVTGVEAALLTGADPGVVGGAYTAAWLGVLSLARA